MALDTLHLKSGNWLVANCGNMPSESNCQLIMLAPEAQREDLISAGTKHAVNKHGHQDTEELHKSVDNMLEVMAVN